MREFKRHERPVGQIQSYFIVLLTVAGCASSSPPAVSRTEYEFQRSAVGVVVDETTDRCLPDAQVLVEGTLKGTLSDTLGRYLLRDLPPRNIQLRATALGYLVEQRELPLPVPYGDPVIVNPGEIVSRTDTVNFYLRPVPHHPPMPESARARSDRSVPCRRS